MTLFSRVGRWFRPEGQVFGCIEGRRKICRRDIGIEGKGRKGQARREGGKKGEGADKRLPHRMEMPACPSHLKEGNLGVKDPQI